MSTYLKHQQETHHQGIFLMTCNTHSLGDNAKKLLIDCEDKIHFNFKLIMNKWTIETFNLSGN